MKGSGERGSGRETNKKLRDRKRPRKIIKMRNHKVYKIASINEVTVKHCNS